MTMLDLMYTRQADWEQLPAGMQHRDVADVAVDSADNVYVLTRMDAAVLVYRRDGSFVTSWGSEHLSPSPHAISIGPHGTVYIADEPTHSVVAFTTAGELIDRIGPSGRPSDTGVDLSVLENYERIATIKRTAEPYNGPTKVAVAPGGDIYVTDGYGNAAVHHFAWDGSYVESFGSPGTDAGQFHLPHSIAVGPDGSLYVCDRENDRVQVLFADGQPRAEWTDLCRPSGICVRDGLAYVGELGWQPGHRTWRNGVIDDFHAGRVTVRTLRGEVVATIGDADPLAPNGFTAPHGVCVDSRGDIYVAQTTWTEGGQDGRYPPTAPTLVKLLRSRS